MIRGQIRRGIVRVFAEGSLREYLHRRVQDLEAEVRAASSNYLLNTNETQYIEYLANRYKVEPVTIDFGDVSVSTREELIRADEFPDSFSFGLINGGPFPKQVITYNLPFTGNSDLLTLRPSAGVLWSTDVRISDGHVKFDVVNWSDRADRIKREADQTLANLRALAEHARHEVDIFNSGLSSEAARVATDRKRQMLQQANLLSSLGVPLKTANSVPATFAVPVEKKSV